MNRYRSKFLKHNFNGYLPLPHLDIGIPSRSKESRQPFHGKIFGFGCNESSLSAVALQLWYLSSACPMFSSIRIKDYT